MAKRQPVDTDYAVFSPFMKDVGAEMEKIMYSTTSKDVAFTKQAEQMGMTAQECAALIIRNRNKRKRPSGLI
jgi:hypothetical protein